MLRILDCSYELKNASGLSYWAAKMNDWALKGIHTNLVSRVSLSPPQERPWERLLG